MGSEKSSTIQDNMTSSSSKKTPVSTAKILNKVGIEDDVEDEGEDVPVSLMSSPAAVTPVAMKKAKPTSSTSITSSASKVSIIKVTEDMSKKLIKASKKEKTSTTDDAGVKKRKAIDIDQSSGKKKKKVNSNKVDDIDNIFNML